MTDQLQLLSLDQIHPSKDNPRRDVGDVTELAASIKSLGILEPLIATTNGKDGGVLLVAGERRLAAAKLAGLKTIPVITRDFSESQRIEAMLVENLQREDLDPLEEANAYKRLFDMGYTQHKLSERIGRSQSHISKRISLLQLPEPARKELDAGGISVQDALELTKLTAHPERIKQAITDRKRSGYMRDMKQSVDQQLEVQKDLDARAAARASLQSAQVKILREEDYVNLYGKPEKALAGQGEYDCLKLTASEHAGKSCHAAIIVRGGKIVYVCTRPGNHPGQASTASRNGENPAARTKRLNGQRAAKEAREARAEKMKALLKSVKKGASSEFILLQLIAVAGSEEARIAQDLLELRQPNRGSVYAPDVVLKYAEKGEKELWRAALALALGAGESNLRTGYAYGRSKTKVGRHLKVLEKAGYRVTAAEKKLT